MERLSSCSTCTVTVAHVACSGTFVCSSSGVCSSGQKPLPGRNQDLHCDVISFNTAISGMKFWSMASKLLSLLAVWSVQRDLSSFTSVIAIQRWPQALNCLKLMRDLGCPGAEEIFKNGNRKKPGSLEGFQPLKFKAPK